MSLRYPAPGRPLGTVVFSDLDGTLLDRESYSWAPAADTVRTLIERGAAIVFCSSKTFAEQRALQEEMGVHAPMVVENGSAVVVPRGYFSGCAATSAAGRWHARGAYVEAVLGLPHRQVVEALREVRRSTGLDARGYADMTPDEVRRRTGLSAPAARRARAREFSETVEVPGGAEAWRVLLHALRASGLHGFGSGPTGTIVGRRADKGTAVRLLSRLYRREAALLDPDGPPLRTVGIGDGANDTPMLRAVDRAFLVERPGGGWAELRVAGIERVRGVGPVGWARAAERILACEEPA